MLAIKVIAGAATGRMKSVAYAWHAAGFDRVRKGDSTMSTSATATQIQIQDRDADTQTQPKVSALSYEIDSSHSSASFKVRHLMVSNVRGEFRKIAGTVVIDEVDVTRSTVDVTI